MESEINQRPGFNPHWGNIFGGSLELPWWLLDGFLPQNFGRWWGPTNHCFAQK